MDICVRMLNLLKYIFIAFLCFMNLESYAYNAGYKELNYKKTTIALWYPSDTKEGKTSYWLWKGEAAENSKIRNGKYPLLIFSHGYGGSRYNQSYLAEFMARNGYIVAAIEYNDRSMIQSLVERPRVTSKALDFILSDSQIKNNIDANKIGMLGHSVGGYTALAVAGGIPDFSKISTSFLKELYIKYKDYDNHFYDKRVKAIAILAPGKTVVFNKKSLSKVTIPVFIMEASRDELVDGNDLKKLASNLPKNPKYFVLKGAGHFAFLPESDEKVREIAPEIGYDPEISRKDLHMIIEKEVLLFFDRVFK